MLEAKIKELDENNKFGSKTFYQSTLSLIKRYKRNNVPIRDITVEWLRDFEKFCLKTVSQTTLAINMRNIRAIMNIAKSAGVIREADYPFGRGKYQIKEGVGKKKHSTRNSSKLSPIIRTVTSSLSFIVTYGYSSISVTVSTLPI